MSELSIRIRQARRHIGHSQAELAKALGVHRSAVAQWESAQAANPTSTHLAHVASATNVRFEWLATGRGRMLTDAQDESAIQLEYLARDSQEEAVLRWFRHLPIKAREGFVNYLRLAWPGGK